MTTQADELKLSNNNNNYNIRVHIEIIYYKHISPSYIKKKNMNIIFVSVFIILIYYVQRIIKFLKHISS